MYLSLYKLLQSAYCFTLAKGLLFSHNRGWENMYDVGLLYWA